MLKEQILRLRDVVRYLRGPNGCKWDQKQEINNFISFMREELDELEDALDKKNVSNFREELGDVLCQIMFIGEICEEKRWFSLSESVFSITEKLIRRHPHIFKLSETDDLESDQVIEQWNLIKAEEKNTKDYFIETTLNLDDAFGFAETIQLKASAVNFDWKDPLEVLEKVKEEVNELEEAIKSAEQDKIEDEIGDVLFSIINLSRFLKVNLNNSLKQSSNKFIKRFKKIEDKLAETGTNLLDSDFSTMDGIWDSIKAENDKKDS